MTVSPVLTNILSTTEQTVAATSSASFQLESTTNLLVYYQVSFEVIGKSRDGPNAYALQSSYLIKSISNGNFTKSLISAAASGSALKNVAGTILYSDNFLPAISTRSFILPSSSPTSAPTKFVEPSFAPTLRPTIYVPPTGEPTSVPTSLSLLPHISSVTVSATRTTITAVVSLTSARLYTS
jgi:hypothetical protein